MNKTQMVKEIAGRIEGASQKDIGVVIDATIETIKETLANGEKIQLVGFGTFEVSERAERMGRNPKTGEEIVIPASKSPKFKAGKAFKDEVNA